MRNKGIFILLAVFPLIAWSCSKAGIVPEEVTATQRMIDPWTVLPLKAVPGNGGPASVTVGGEETKSQLNGTNVVWTAGDEFIMFGYTKGDNSATYGTYSTSAGGAVASFSTSNAPGSGKAGYYSFYPATSVNNWGTYGIDEDFIIGVKFPVNQIANPGNVAEGANLSFARSTTPNPEGNLHFTNFVSLIKFRLDGDILDGEDPIKKVTFIGTTDMVGDLVLIPNGANLEVLPNVSFSGDKPSRSVSLTLAGGASFAKNTDYYIAVAPSAHDSFRMVFENAGGTKRVSKLSSKVLTLNRSHITNFGTIALGNSFDDDSMAPVAWNTHDPSHSKYATIAVIPDGYGKDEMNDYVTDATAGLDALFKTEPYKSYKEYFNVWILKVASNESGARISDGTLEQQNRDCFFQSSWKAEKYDDMRANDNRVFQFVQDNCPDIINGTHEIKDVPILMIINDARFGGIAWNFSDGSTYCMVPKTYDGDPIEWAYPTEEAKGKTNTRSDGLHAVTSAELLALGGSNVGTWKNTLVHEFGGHSIAKLGDEYWYPNENDKEAVEAIAQHTWPVPMYLNVSAKSDVTPWDGLFDTGIQEAMAAKSSLYAERINVFQGADVSTFNRWRSEKISCMIDNRFYFSTWQRYLIVNRIMTLAGLSKLTVSDFLVHDDPIDPKRDGVSSPVMRPVGVSDIVPPRPVPMLPPPRYVDKPAL